MNLPHFRAIVAMTSLLATVPLWGAGCQRRSDRGQHLASAPAGGAEEKSRWPRKADELQVSLSVVYALEDGPFVCKVNLKNVSKRALDYAVGERWHEAHCVVVADWQVKKEPLSRAEIYCGPAPPFTLRLAPGESASPTFYLHRSFLGVPAGHAPLRFGWDLHRTKKTPKKEDESKEKVWRPEIILQYLFSLKGTQTVNVLPATQDNVAQVLHALETDFVGVAQKCERLDDFISGSDEPARDWVETIGGCRHKEFVPLLLRAMDCLPSAYERGELVRAVYDSFPTPEEGFTALAAYLDSPRAASAAEVFNYWQLEQENHEEGKHRQVQLLIRPKTDPSSKGVRLEEQKWTILPLEEDAWRTSRRHLDTRLTQEQFGRLRAMKSVWVRTLLYTHFPKQCPADWVAALRADLRRIAHPPEGMKQLIAQLDDDRFEVRERATHELTRWRDTFAVYLWSVPQEKLSLEASRRLREVLRGLSRTKLPPLPRRVLSHLAWCGRPEGRELLDILRRTEPPNLITREAQAIFQKHQDHEKEMNRLREGKEESADKSEPRALQ